MATQRETLEILIRMLEAEKAAQDAENLADANEKVGNSADDAKGKLSNYQQEITMLKGAAIAAGLALIKSVPDMVAQGVEADRAKLALEAYAGSHEEAEKAIALVTEATGGAISEFEATQNATRLFSMGLATNAEEAATLAEIATTLGAAVGVDAKESFESFALMLANSSIPRLDTFGLSSGQVRDRINELMEANEGLDRQTAFTMATIEAGTEKLNELDAVGFEAASNIDRLQAAVENAKNGMAQWVSDGLMPVIDGAYMMIGAMEDEDSQLVTTTDSYDEYLIRLAEITGAQPGMVTGWNTLTEAEYNEQKQIEENVQAAEDYETSLEGLREGMYASTTTTSDYETALEDAEEATAGLETATNTLDVALKALTAGDLGKKQFDALTEAYENGTLSGDEYASAVKQVGTNMMGLTGAEVDAAIAVAKLEKAFADGEIDVYEYVGALKAIHNTMQGLPDEHNYDLYINVHGKIPKLPGTRKPGRKDPLADDEDPEYYQTGLQTEIRGAAGADNVWVGFWGTDGETLTVTPRGEHPPSMAGAQTMPGSPAQSAGATLIVEGDLILQGLENPSDMLEQLNALMIPGV